MRIDVMQGQLEELDLAQILQVVGLGRQYTGVEVRRGSEVTGTIFVKSGKVVSVDAREGAGREAFFRLFRDPGSDFSVFRMETPLDLPEPVGALSWLLMEAMQKRGVTMGSVPPKSPTAPPPSQNWEVPTRSGSGASSAGQADRAGAPNHTAPNHTAPASFRAAVPSTSLDREAPEEPPLGGTRPATDLEARSARAQTTTAGQRPAAVVAIASPKGGSGKTTTSLNLALALARQGRTVTLVDADINGDVLSSINARERARIGVYDLLQGRGRLEDALFKTVLPGFQILGAVGLEVPEPSVFATDRTPQFRELMRELSARSEVVVVDTPSGMFGVTHQILASATHVIGVLQAEVVASRSFERFTQGLEALPASERPSVLGVLLNMLQVQQGASVNVFQGACADLPKTWLFDTCVPRNPAFLLATDQGLPLRHLDEQAPPAVAWLYDNLAGEVVERLALPAVERRPQALLL